MRAETVSVRAGTVRLRGGTVGLRVETVELRRESVGVYHGTVRVYNDAVRMYVAAVHVYIAAVRPYSLAVHANSPAVRPYSLAARGNSPGVHVNSLVAHVNSPGAHFNSPGAQAYSLGVQVNSLAAQPNTRAARRYRLNGSNVIDVPTDGVAQRPRRRRLERVMRRVAVCFAFLFFFAIVLIGSGELIGAPIVGVPVSPTPEISYILDTAAIPPLVPGQHSRLVVHNCFGGFGTVYAPSATVDGTEIAVTQNLVWGGSSEACAWHIIDLGLLPAATYHVTMLRTSSTGTDASDFRFIVQQPDRTAACTQSQSVTALPDGTALLRYEGQYYGSAPSFGLPAVVSTACCNTDDVKWLRIVQPVDDTAHGQYVCHAEQLNIGHVADGVYVVDWLYSPLAPFSGRPSPSLGQFKWSGGTLQCSSVSAFSIGGPAVANEPIDAMRTHLFDGYWRSSFKVSRTSNRITVDELLTIGEGPVPSAPPDCGSIHVPIGPLPAGEYDVVWTVHYDTGGGSETGTLHVTVSNPKRRAARH